MQHHRPSKKAHSHHHKNKKNHSAESTLNSNTLFQKELPASPITKSSPSRFTHPSPLFNLLSLLALASAAQACHQIITQDNSTGVFNRLNAGWL